jgi:hypothetical protein
MFRNAAITKAQLLYVFKGLSRLVIWLEIFLEGFNEIFVSPPAWFVSFCFFAFFDFRLDKLLLPDSSVSICQVGQDKGYLLFVIVVCESVYFEVNINILHEQDKITSFPCKGFQWVKLDVFRGFRCCGCNSFRHCFFFVIGVGIVLCQGFISRCQGIKCCQSIVVSSIVESKSRGIGLSGFRGIKVSGCAVKIRARSLLSLHFC